MIPSATLGRWLKDHPHADRAHRILRYNRDLLVSFCGRTIPAAQAVASLQSVACCSECTRLWREQKDAHLRALARKYPGKRKSQP